MHKNQDSNRGGVGCREQSEAADAERGLSAEAEKAEDAQASPAPGTKIKI